MSVKIALIYNINLLRNKLNIKISNNIIVIVLQNK